MKGPSPMAKKKPPRKKSSRTPTRKNRDHEIAILTRIIKTGRNLTGVQVKTLADLVAEFKG